MATGDIASRNNDPLAMLTQLLTTFKGGPTTTQTSSEQVSNDKVTAYLQQILGGTSGLAAVSSGQKAAGMYNSTVNQQMTNDLLTRASAQTAALSSTKTSTSQVGPQANPLATIGMMLGGQVAGSLLGPALKVGKKKLGLDDLGQKISDAIFGPSSGGMGALGESVSNVYPAAFDTMPINSAALQSLDDLSGMNSNSNPSSAGGVSASDAAALGFGSAAATSALGSTAAATGSGYVVGAESAIWGSALAGESVAGAGATAAGATAATVGAEAAAGTAGTAAAGAGFGDAIVAAGPYALAAAAILGALQGPTSLSGSMSNVLSSLTAQLSGSGG